MWLVKAYFGALAFFGDFHNNCVFTCNWYGFRCILGHHFYLRTHFLSAFMFSVGTRAVCFSTTFSCPALVHGLATDCCIFTWECSGMLGEGLWFSRALHVHLLYNMCQYTPFFLPHVGCYVPHWLRFNCCPCPLILVLFSCYK